VFVCVSGILFEAGLEKSGNNNSPVLRSSISSQNLVREEIEFFTCRRFLAQIIPS